MISLFTAAVSPFTGKQTACPKSGIVFCHCFILSAIGYIIYIKNASNPFARIRAKQIAGITYKPDSRAQCEKSRCHSDGRKTQLHLYGSTISGDCQYSSCMGRKYELDQRERFHEKMLWLQQGSGKPPASRLFAIKAHSKIVGCYRLFESSVHQPVFNFDPVQLFQHRLRAEPEEDERGNRAHQIDRDAGDVITHDDLPVDRIRPHKR